MLALGKQGSGPTGLQGPPSWGWHWLHLSGHPPPLRYWLWENPLGTGSAQLLGVGPSHLGVKFPGDWQAAPILLQKAKLLSSPLGHQGHDGGSLGSAGRASGGLSHGETHPI